MIDDEQQPSDQLVDGAIDREQVLRFDFTYYYSDS